MNIIDKEYDAFDVLSPRKHTGLNYLPDVRAQPESNEEKIRYMTARISGRKSPWVCESCGGMMRWRGNVTGFRCSECSK